MCILFCLDDDRTAISDSYCKLYEPVLRTQADNVAAKRSSSDLVRRVAKNDIKYRCLCQGWQNPICKQ